MKKEVKYEKPVSCQFILTIQRNKKSVHLSGIVSLTQFSFHMFNSKIPKSKP